MEFPTSLAISKRRVLIGAAVIAIALVVVAILGMVSVEAVPVSAGSAPGDGSASTISTERGGTHNALLRTQEMGTAGAALPTHSVDAGDVPHHPGRLVLDDRASPGVDRSVPPFAHRLSPEDEAVDRFPREHVEITRGSSPVRFDDQRVAGSHGPVAECSVDPTRIQPGETVTISAEGSTGVAADYDFTGDGHWEVQQTTQVIIHVTFEEEGEFTPVVRIWNAAGEAAVAECDTIVVSQEGFGILPPGIGYIPLVIYSLGLLGLVGLLWWGMILLGGITRGDHAIRYRTGTFEVPTESGSLSFDGLGFEPDVLLFRATNRGRLDDVIDRTAGWSYGLAIRNPADTRRFIPGIPWRAQSAEIVSRTVTVGDDARRRDRATGAVHTDRVVDLIKHGSADPGRVTARLADTTDDGFELDIHVPGDEHGAGGTRVHYQAMQIGPTKAVTGHVHSPQEGGHLRSIDLGLDADLVEVMAAWPVTALDDTVTTDQAVGLSIGRAVRTNGSLRSTVGSFSIWPGQTADTAATCAEERLMALLELDADTITGRIQARATELGQELRIFYDRVDTSSTPASTDGAVLTYLAVESGSDLRPAIGTVPFPQPGESEGIEIGFEPGLIELEVVGAELGEERTAGAGAQPFEWSFGTAIPRNGTIIQHVLHQSVSPARGGGHSPGVQAETAHFEPRAIAADGGGETGVAAQIAGDGIAASWLVQESNGRIVGRDDLHVEQITETGFTVTVDTVSTDQREDSIARPTVMYRVWPAEPATRTNTTESASTDPNDTQQP